ncbi:MAG: YdbH domain-containing protein [Gammaproteobacteria bacterium]|jgi:hypothetical protein|nr:YdbH domain-containing protein [Gammaproteobacteria bacterium]
MLSKLLRFVILPILLVIILIYAAIPLWLPFAAQYSQAYTDIEVQQLEVGYPKYDRWHIQHLEGQQESSEHLTRVRLQNVELSYNLLELWYGKLPNISIAKVSFDSHLAQASIDAAPILLLLPQRWLSEFPENLTIERISGNISAPDTALGQAFTVAGKFNADPEHAHAIAKITTEDNKNLFFEADFANDNAIGATLFTKQQSAPIAKLTSQMRQSGSLLNWQGQMALNVPVMQKLLASFIPDQFALPVEQGRLISHWQVDVPSDQQQSLQQWLQAAHGEHQFQLQIQTNTKLAKDIYLDANVTHIVDEKKPDQWQINAGSLLSLKPDWHYFKLQKSTIDNLSLHAMEVRMTAQGPVALKLEPNANNMFGAQQALLLDGVFNATLQSPNGQYQLFTQLKNLSYSNTNTWHGQADVSGYYVLPQQHPLLQQIPLGIQQVQALAQVDFNMSPSSWQVKLAPNSKLSANQVESQQRQSQVLLFANDRLNLSNAEPLELTYNITNDEWQWNDINLSLQPQTATGTSQANSAALGLRIQLPAGRSQFNNRPSQGSYQLHARDTRLRGWPEFDLLGEGMVIFDKDKIILDFAGQAQPFAPALQGQFEWDFAQQKGLLSSTAKAIDLPAMQAKHQVNWPLKVTAGNIDYAGLWRWQQNSQQSQHQFQLHDVNGSSKLLAVSGLNGKIKVQPDNNKLATSYQLQAQILQPKAYSSALALNQATLHINSSSPLHKGLAKAMAAPESWSLQDANGQFLGGTLSLQPREKGDKWNLDNIQLDQLAQTLWPELETEGTLSGHMLLTKAWQIQQLQVKTNQGARLHLRQPLPEGQLGADTFNQLLSNMQVAELEAHSQAPQVGNKLPLSLRLQGRSPDFNDGQPVDLNLTVEANLEPWIAP